MRNVSAVLGVAFTGLLALGACDVAVKDEGKLPEVSVESGELPEVEVTGPSVEVGKTEVDVPVPEIEMTDEQVTVPTVDVELPADR